MLSAVQYDQVKIVIKQMANHRPILHVQYYYQGKLVQVKFTVESTKIQNFLRATIDEAKLKKVEIDSDQVKLNYRNIGSIEIKNYQSLKKEPLFKEFDERVVQQSAKKRKKEKTLSKIKNLKVNHQYKFWPKKKKTAAKVGAAILVSATLAGALTTLDRFFPFQQNKSKVEAEGTDLDQMTTTDIEHSTITLAKQEENQKVKVLFSQTNNTPSKESEEVSTNQQEETPSVEATEEHDQVESVETAEKENDLSEQKNENPTPSVSQSTDEEKNTNWYNTQLESAQDLTPETTYVTPGEEKETMNPETSSSSVDALNEEDTSVNKETESISESETKATKKESTEEVKSAVDQATMNSIETAQVPEQEIIAESKENTDQENTMNDTQSLNIDDQQESPVVQETAAEESTPIQENQESSSGGETVSVSEDAKEETTSNTETSSASTESETQMETTGTDSLTTEQASTNTSEETVEQETISEEKETESASSIASEDSKTEEALTTEVNTHLETATDSQNSTSSETETTNQTEEIATYSNSSIEASSETTGSSTGEAVTPSQITPEAEASSIQEVSLHQEQTSEESEEQQNLTATTEISTASESSATPITLAYHEEVAVSDQNTIKSGYHYTTGNTTYPMSEEDFYKLVVIINAESNKTYEDALGVASVIANRVEDGGWGGDMPLEIATAQGQFVVWQNSSVRSAAAAAASSGSFDNAEVVKAARDCFFGGIRNNDYVEFKSASSPTYSSSGEKKYQIVSGGNKYHHLAENLNRVNQNQYSSTDIATNFDSTSISYDTNEEENNRSLSA